MAKNTGAIVENPLVKEIEMKKLPVSEAQNTAFEKQAAMSIGALVLAFATLAASHALHALTEAKEPEVSESKE